MSSGVVRYMRVTIGVLSAFAAVTALSIQDSSATADPPSVPPGTLSTLAIAGQMNIPNPLKMGVGVTVQGLVTSNYAITQIEAQIVDASGAQLYDESATPDATSFNVGQWDNQLLFSHLPLGDYTYTVTASDDGGAALTLQSVSFTVADVACTLSLTDGMTVPSTLPLGTGVTVTGTVAASGCAISSITAQIADSTGVVAFGPMASPNDISFNLGQWDNTLMFSQLPAGSYTYTVAAQDSDGQPWTLTNQAFTVDGTTGATTGTTPTSAAPPADVSAATAPCVITFLGSGTVPNPLPAGKGVTVAGTMFASGCLINQATAQITDATGGVVYGQSVTLNSESFSVVQWNHDLLFSQLATGNYIYTVTATDSNGKVWTLANQSFGVGTVAALPLVSCLVTLDGGMTVPNPMNLGSFVTVTGTVTATGCTIASLTAQISDATGAVIYGPAASPNAPSFDLGTWDNILQFSKMPAGAASYVVTAIDSTGKTWTLTNQSFTVVAPPVSTVRYVNTCVPYSASLLDPNDQFAVPTADVGLKTAQAMLQIALSQVGYHEGTYYSSRNGQSNCVYFPTGGNWTKYGAVYNWGTAGYAWCAAFVNWAAQQAGILDTVVPVSPAVGELKKGYEAKGTFHAAGTYTPKPGDAIIYYQMVKNGNTYSPFYSHVGIVVSVSGGKVNTVEGNTSDNVALRTHSLTDATIYGYGANS